MIMEEDISKLYEALLKLNKKVSELDQRNTEIQAAISSMSPPAIGEEKPVIDQETTMLDAYNISGYKSLSLPDGGFVRLKSRSLCVNGRHVVDSTDKMLFCSKCDAIICTDHRYDLDETVCAGCLEKRISDFDSMSLYVLFALENGISIRKLRKRLNIPWKEIEAALDKLQKSNCIFRDLLFRYRINIYGESAVDTAKLIMDFSFLEPPAKD